MDQSFSGKIILLGEYSIISGSSAMLIPLPQFSGKLQMPVPNIPAELEAEQSNFELRDFFLYLSSQQEKWKHTLELDTCRMGTDLDRGLYFLSSIPVQFGAGSSAASLHTTVAAGTTLFLAVSAITLTSGLAICYYDQVI